MRLKRISLALFFVVGINACATVEDKNMMEYETVSLDELQTILESSDASDRKISVTGPTRLSRRSQVLYYDEQSAKEIFGIPCLQMLMPVDLVFQVTGRTGSLHGEVFTILGELEHHPEIASGLSSHSSDEIVLSIELADGIEVNEVVRENDDLHLRVHRVFR
ncbi:hypothetical protein [Hyphococcus lacteus]|uniref:Uncharacterized protein n=1 Tax=Hyphococcus lacteus TaxID=3143536 RepID=A0ABV3Z763_9PROT